MTQTDRGRLDTGRLTLQSGHCKVDWTLTDNTGRLDTVRLKFGRSETSRLDSGRQDTGRLHFWQTRQYHTEHWQTRDWKALFLSCQVVTECAVVTTTDIRLAKSATRWHHCTNVPICHTTQGEQGKHQQRTATHYTIARGPLLPLVPGCHLVWALVPR